jgi:hypothetical protein
MKSMNKFYYAFLVLMFVYFTNTRSGLAQQSFNLSLDSVISLLTSGVWYDSYSGDLPLTETSFVRIPNSIDSLRWENVDFKLIRSEKYFTYDSTWVLQPGSGTEPRYEITLLDEDKLCLSPMVMDGISSTYLHVKPQPASPEAKKIFIEEISGDWSVAEISPNHEHQKVTRVNFEISYPSPDSIIYTGYEGDSLLWSEKYMIILVYQQYWYLIKNKLHGYFFSYKDGFLFNVMFGANEFGGETSLYLKRTSPLDKAEYNLKSNRMELFPNPCNNFFTISSDIILKKIEIVGLNGQLLITKNLSEKVENTFDISTLSNGVYMVKGFSNNECFSAKLIKQQ